MQYDLKLKDELKTWLVDASDTVRLEEIIFIKKSQLNSLKKQKNFHGYQFEFDM